MSIDNLTIPQFILDDQCPTNSMRGHDIPWLIEDATGKKVGVEEVSHRLRIYVFGALPTRNLRSFEAAHTALQTPSVPDGRSVSACDYSPLLASDSQRNTGEDDVGMFCSSFRHYVPNVIPS